MNLNYRFSLAITLVLGLNLLPLSETYAQSRNTPDRVADRFYTPASRVSHPSLGQRITVLPNAHKVVRVGAQSYRYSNGSFYRSASQGGYVVVRAPLNARVSALPRGSVSFWMGSRRYHYANFTYYLWDSDRRDYVVVAEPEGAETEIAEASQSSGQLYVYPAQGQTDEQRDRDRYECYVWASGETGFDPSSDSTDIDLASDYRRANSACLEGRGYSVN